MASEKEVDPNQPNSEVCGSRKSDSKHVRRLRGNSIFCGGPGFQTDLKHIWDLLNSFSNLRPE